MSHANMASVVHKLGFLCYFFVVFLHFTAIECATPYEEITQYKEEYSLPDLPYGYDGLEPFIDEATLQVHHLGHHAAYTKKLNAALKSWRKSRKTPELSSKPIATILNNIELIPYNWQLKIRNNGGGYVNHALYWAIMSPNPNNEERKPNGRVAQLIDETFGTYSNFQSIVENTALGVFGSGYAWLCLDVEQGGLKILGSTNQDSPLNQHGLLPILVIDVWEHAYYLKHQNRRAAYVKSFWNIINWDAVSELLEWWPKQIKRDEL